MVGTIICDIRITNVRFYLLEVQYPRGYCKITHAEYSWLIQNKLWDKIKILLMLWLVWNLKVESKYRKTYFAQRSIHYVRNIEHVTLISLICTFGFHKATKICFVLLWWPLKFCQFHSLAPQNKTNEVLSIRMACAIFPSWICSNNKKDAYLVYCLHMAYTSLV